MYSVGTLDSLIMEEAHVYAYVCHCIATGEKPVLDMRPEGSCAMSLRLYYNLDYICELTGYDKKNITIITGNMIERHHEYDVRRTWCLYEVSMIREWLDGKAIDCGTTPDIHFSNFTSRSNWPRLWIATLLKTKYPTHTIQTYHYDITKENVNERNNVGLDELAARGCDLLAEAAEFIKHSPYTIDIDFLRNLDNCKDSVYQHDSSYYPIQHPSNLNLLQYYRRIFVDIVVEPNVTGNSFMPTEKVWRPIVARRPFIVMSNNNYLHHLRRLGFKTFPMLWSEEYDQYSGVDRIKKIDEILQKISEYTVSELHDLLVQIKEITDHNYNTFVSFDITQTEKEFGITTVDENGL